MNMNEVYQLMDKFEQSTLGEISVEMEGVKFSAKKGCSYGAPALVTSVPSQATIPAPVHTEATAKTTVAESGVAHPSKEDGKVITAPLVGTFYCASGPGEAPFVEVGQSVKAGDVVGIIEAMKLMNEITATCDGVVEEVLVEDGEMVEFAKSLIRLV